LNVKWDQPNSPDLHFLTFLLSTALETVLLFMFSEIKHSSGPYCFVFACFVQFSLDIPAAYRFRICGMNSNDKLFPYIVGLQLLFSNFPASFLAACCGVASGLIYRLERLKLKKFQFPAVVNSLAARFFLPLLRSPQSSLQRNPVPLPGTGSHSNVSTSRLGSVNHPRVNHLDQEQLIARYDGSNVSESVLASPVLNEQSVQMLVNMGFPRDDAVRALTQCHNDVQLATNLLLGL